MFKNFKITVKLASPVCTIHDIHLDALISAAKAKELLGDEFYNGKNVEGEEMQIRGMLDSILDKRYEVYCASVGIGEYKEYTSTWAKRWDDKNDSVIAIPKRGKHRVDRGAGFFKDYHMPVVLRTYNGNTIFFYARGDMQEVERLLNTYISHIGKKSSQGYGEVLDYAFEEIEEDLSIFNNGKLIKSIPVEYKEEYFKHCNNDKVELTKIPTIPPYWRNDNLRVMLMCESRL